MSKVITVDMTLSLHHNKGRAYVGVLIQPKDALDVQPFQAVGQGPTLDKAVKTLGSSLARYVVNVLMDMLHQSAVVREQLQGVAASSFEREESE